ncbi:cobalamin synthase [Candidatus Methanoplasma termitum]|uniref:Adenosylcobinamide-GDP ribazoletransferase n=1 Tax=Candidatus Methanoplasma termitum TaxID=1577791 RepID=A0A0A7LAW6_9ARCH|nr:adenosylcobinamide-GDP ribazoletransferase [Candidatus Methanoplasma termitum]AIZ56128.1 cobalamin synthase [Candidatus Methanoplasma termitum]MCL2334231.1 adenosylcobinamide-GDP ribazoletransferase [Candidatus Methanoplasma sp.]
MPNETNDRVGKEEALNRSSDRQKDGSVSTGADANNKSNAGAATPPEDESIDSNRSEQRPIRKMSAADFKVKSEPKPEPRPEPRPEVKEPVQPPAPHKETKPVQPSSGIPSSRPAGTAQEKPVQKPVEATPMKEHPKAAPAPEPAPVYREPVYEQPKYEYSEPAKEPKYERSEPVKESKRKEEEPPASEPKGTSPGGILGALKAAFSFFTILPIKASGEEINAMTKNMYVIPIVGAFIGMIASIMGIIFARVDAGAMAGIAILATSYIISKFLHLDGLADFGDGMICSGDRERSIKALKDTGIGAGGLGIVLIVILAIYAGISGVAVVFTTWIPGFFLFAMAIVIMEAFAKNTMVVAAAFGEPGNGMASEQVRNTNTQTMLFATLIAVCSAFVGYLLMAVITGGFWASFQGIWSARVMITALLMIVGGVVSSFVIGWLIAYLSNRKFGFLNGDGLGAANEISKVMFLFIALMVLGFYTLH